MEPLKGYQRKFLRGLAHDLNPVVLIGMNGLTDQVVQSIEQALDDHELIKIKFNDYKEKKMKAEICETIGERTDSEMVGMIGHTAVFYRRHPDAERRRVRVPTRE